MVNKWMEHVKSVRAGNPGKSLKDILKMAKKTYKKSPVTKAAKKHYRKTKRHHKKHHKKHHKGKKRKRGQRGGEHNTDMAHEAGEAAPPSTQGGDAGTALSGSGCPLPTQDGSGSVTQADLKACGAAPNMCGGKRKSKKRKSKSRKRRKTKRKSRKRRRKRKH